MHEVFLYLIFFFISLFFAGLFAFLETSFTALRLFKLKELESTFSKYKNLFKCWEENPQRILITILIANNFAHVLSSVLITEVMQVLLGNVGLAVGVPTATIMILIFGEIMPKSLAKTHHERIFHSSLFIINFLYKLLYPLVSVLLKIAKGFFSYLGRPDLLDIKDNVSEKEIEFLIDYSDEKGLIEAEKSEMLQNVFELGQTLVKEIMVPTTDVKNIDIDSGLDEAMEILSKYRYSRLPVFKDKEENIVGIIHQKDIFELIYKNQKKPLADLVRPILFVPESKRINQLLSEFLKKGRHMAIVVDEYGSIAGLVTLEDVIEQIVGQIRDEHEKIRTEIVPLEEGGWIIDAGISLEEMQNLLGIKFEVEESITLAGFMNEKLQHLPQNGEKFSYRGYSFKVQNASPRRVLQVLVVKEKEDSEEIK
ncbi:MAG: hemolysin family protein [bacterium]